MSFRVWSVSGRSRVPRPPTRITAGRLTARADLGRAADAVVGEAGRTQLGRVEHVPAVDQQRIPHAPGRLAPVELGELGPLGHEHGRVGAVERLQRVGADRRLRQRRDAVGDRVPRAHVRALGDEPAGEHEARRLAHVVGVRLEREPEQRDRLAAQAAEVLLQLPDHAPLLQLVHLDHGVQELEVVARVRGELLQRERVLREAAAAVADARRAGSSSRSAGRGRRPRRRGRRRRRSPRRRSRSR